MVASRTEVEPGTHCDQCDEVIESPPTYLPGHVVTLWNRLTESDYQVTLCEPCADKVARCCLSCGNWYEDKPRYLTADPRDPWEISMLCNECWDMEVFDE